MIVKFLKRGSGSCSATMDYLLGKTREREGAKILQGNPEITRHLAEGLQFKNKYTVGVLSFEEKDISEKDKAEIMESFENTLLAGLDKERYNITWIEHQDKGRLELNFVIPKVDLDTGKSMNPYFDRTDRELIDTWKNVINHEYQLTDPNDPAKKQALVVANNLPEDKKELQQAITGYLMQRMADGQVKSREDVLNALQADLGLSVARITPSAISIKDPTNENGRNIRLKGEIYAETFRFSEDYSRENERASQDYRQDRNNRISGTRAELERLVEAKRTFNEDRFRAKGRSATQPDRQDLRSVTGEPGEVDKAKRTDRQSQDSNSSHNQQLDHSHANSDRGELLAWEVDSEPLRREDGIRAADRENTDRAQNIGENRLSGGKGDYLSENQEGSGSQNGLRGSSSGIDQEINNQELTEDEQRIFQQIREITGRIESGRSGKERANQAIDRANRELNRSKSSLEQRIPTRSRADRAIERISAAIRQLKAVIQEKLSQRVSVKPEAPEVKPEARKAQAWTKDDLLQRGLTDKQADYCLKEQKKAFNPMWAEDAQLRQLEKIQDRLNTQIENGTVGKDQDRGR